MKVEINIAEEKVGVGTCNGHMIISALFASSMLKDWPFGEELFGRISLR